MDGQALKFKFLKSQPVAFINIAQEAIQNKAITSLTLTPEPVAQTLAGRISEV